MIKMLRPGWDGGRGGYGLSHVPGACSTSPASHPGRANVWSMDPVVAVAEAPSTDRLPFRRPFGTSCRSSVQSDYGSIENALAIKRASTRLAAIIAERSDETSDAPVGSLQCSSQCLVVTNSKSPGASGCPTPGRDPANRQCSCPQAHARAGPYTHSNANRQCPQTAPMSSHGQCTARE
jgi:hypothetical protein